MKNFCFVCCIRTKISKPKSVSAWSVHKSGQHSFQRVPPAIFRIILSLFKILESPSCTRLKLSRPNQRTNFVMKNFCFVCCIRTKISKPKSVSAWSVHKSGQHSFQRVPPAIFRIILSLFKILESPSCNKDNFCLSSKLISVQLHACRSLYDKYLNVPRWVTRLAGVAFIAKSSKAKHICFKTLYISQPSYSRNHQKPQRTHKVCKMFAFRNI